MIKTLATCCSKGFVKCFLKVPSTGCCLYCSCHESKGNFKKTFYKTFRTSCRPRQYFKAAASKADGFCCATCDLKSTKTLEQNSHPVYFKRICRTQQCHAMILFLPWCWSRVPCRGRRGMPCTRQSGPQSGGCF